MFGTPNRRIDEESMTKQQDRRDRSGNVVYNIDMCCGDTRPNVCPDNAPDKL